MTPKQNRTIHAMLQEQNLMWQKENLVNGFGEGKAKSITELTNDEADAMIAFLKQSQPQQQPKLTEEQEKCQKMRRSIISMAWQMNWTYLNTKREVKCDIKRIDEWCAKYGYIKKEKLNDYIYSELPQLVTQFRNAYKSYINGLHKNT